MPLLSPANEPGSPNVINGRGSNYSPEVELLRKSGIIKTGDGIEGHFIDIMNEVGLSPTNILTRIGMIMDSGESDGVKLAAAKMALQLHMHPAIVPTKIKEEQQRPNITFVIQSPQVNMQNVLSPSGDQKLESW